MRAIVRMCSVLNLFLADRTFIISPFDLVHELILLLQVDGVEHCLVLSKLLEESLLLESHLFHLRFALIRNFGLLLEPKEVPHLSVQALVALFMGCEHFSLQLEVLLVQLFKVLLIAFPLLRLLSELSLECVRFDLLNFEALV